MKFIDLTGQVFGRLTVIDRVVNSFGGKARWRCWCICGEETLAYSANLRRGHTQSCGCLRQEARVINATTHGLSRTKVWAAWASMKARCFNKNTDSYARYGGRGINICERWLNSFENFYDDMGEPPTPLHSVEREDNDRGYSPCNCYWATQSQQANNKSTSCLVTFKGVTRTITQWGRETGLEGCLRDRLFRYGWSLEKAFTTPVRRRRKRL